MNKTKTQGLRQRMAKAESTDELRTLAMEACSYTEASKHTRQRWVNTAKRRNKQLTT